MDYPAIGIGCNYCINNLITVSKATLRHFFDFFNPIKPHQSPRLSLTKKPEKNKTKTLRPLFQSDNTQNNHLIGDQTGGAE